MVLDRAEIETVIELATDVADPDDNPLLDVLEQTAARWLCTDDKGIHAIKRPEVIGLGQLASMIKEVC